MTAAFRSNDPRRPGRSTRRAAALAIAAVGVFRAVAQPLEVEIVRLDGTSLRGVLRGLEGGITVDTAEGAARLPWSDLLSLQNLQPAESEPAGPESAPLRFELADGSAFFGRIVEPTARGCVVALPDGARADVELSAFRSIAWRGAGEAAREQLARLAGRADGGGPAGDARDVAVVRKGEETLELRGAVSRLEADRVTFTWNGREVPLPWNRLAGVLFASPAERIPSCRVRLSNGSTYCGRIAGGGAGVLSLQSGVLGKLELAWNDVERIDCGSDRLVFLSDLQPSAYEFEPFFDKHWNYALDTTLTGGPIRLGGRGFTRGVTMHSQARLSFDIARGGFQQFAAAAGILDEMGERGCVTMRVLDGERVLWEAEEIRGGQPPQTLLVPVSGVRTLVLEVGFGDGVDLSDQACWAFARLIR